MQIGKQPSINSAKAKYLSQFPAFFHPYIDDIVDVEPDGNCGFCCISSALGWGKKHGKEKWMTIPDMGYHVASKYSVVFVSLSMRMNIAFFPLLIASPLYTSRHTIIDVGFVNSNHWVQIKLRLGCPLSFVTDRWRNNCSNNAKAWESAYASRFTHWETLAGNSDIRKNVSMEPETVEIL
ncbi:uncharacterized protein LOC131619355 [Vicia villosa]|uniref:uncharacterized protein LOC131619355 n=1 Tax=Vicia villosa TaxID=3911 RepID=UPI00273B8247|nr:uncharacterized protein LOC131619355 [Vicia villosa]